jgi:hypothetical protein
MTEERKAELEAYYQQLERAEEQKALSGAVVDGVEQIQAALTQQMQGAEAAVEPEMVLAGKAARKGRLLKQQR